MNIFVTCIPETLKGEHKVHPSPCATIRVISLLSYLENNNKITWNIASSKRIFKDCGDLVLLNRFPFANTYELDCFLAWRKENETVPVIYDLDDNLIEKPPLKHPDYDHIMKNRYQVLPIMKSSSDIIVSTERLASLVNAQAPAARVHHLPNRFLPQYIKTLGIQSLREPPRVLFMGTSSHMQSISKLEELFNPDSSLFMGLKLDIIGFGEYCSEWIRSLPLGSPSPNDLARQLNGLQGYICGLAPLFGDPDFEKYKTDIKAYDYLYAGLPVVASKKEPYLSSDLVANCGVLVEDSIREWRKAVKIFENYEYGMLMSKKGVDFLNSSGRDIDSIAMRLYSIMIHSLSHS